MSHVLAAVAWPYANGPRHIGHVSGFGVPSDVFSRYMRMAGHDVLMVSGTDEHGTPIQVQADADGVTPRELADRYNRVIVEDLHGLGLSYDLFTRTTTRNHYAVVQELFAGLHANGYIVAKTTLGAISPSTGRTLPDRYIEGTCPICGYDERPRRPVRQLRQPARPRAADQPAVARSTARRRSSSRPSTSSSTCRPSPRRWARGWTPREGWRPNVLKFSRNLLDDLQPRAITRDLEWGVPIPLDGWRDRNDKRIYVWFDAVIGYLSASDRVGPPLRRPGGVAQVVVGRRRGPGRAWLLLHGQGQHRLPLGDLAVAAARLLRRGRQGRQARASSGGSTCRPRWSPAST